jgi:predicted Fe-Mo cluster-binding NifX family protein
VRIAVPTNNGSSISPHFGRSAAFLVFEVEDGRIGSPALRPNGACHAHAPGGGHEAHSHAGILASLEGCDVVLCGGMGWRAAEALRSAGIAAVMVGAPLSPENAVRAYLDGELPAGQEGFCRCSH